MLSVNISSKGMNFLSSLSYSRRFSTLLSLSALVSVICHSIIENSLYSHSSQANKHCKHIQVKPQAKHSSWTPNRESGQESAKKQVNRSVSPKEKRKTCARQKGRGKWNGGGGGALYAKRRSMPKFCSQHTKKLQHTKGKKLERPSHCDACGRREEGMRVNEGIRMKRRVPARSLWRHLLTMHGACGQRTMEVAAAAAAPQKKEAPAAAAACQQQDQAKAKACLSTVGWMSSTHSLTRIHNSHTHAAYAVGTPIPGAQNDSDNESK